MAEIEERRPFGARVRYVGRRFVRHDNGVLAIVMIVLVAVLQVLTKGKLVTRANVANVILQSSTRGLASIGQTFVILTAGIDLSVGGVALLSMMIGATLMTGTTPFPTGPVAIMLLFATGVGMVNGTLVSRIGIPALIVTLGMWQITYGFSHAICKGAMIVNLPPPYTTLVQARVAGGVPVPAIIFIASAVVAYLVLYYSAFGRSIYAVGGNQVSAYLSGINTRRTILLAYVVSGFMAGLAGLISMGRMGSAAMASTLGLELDSIAAVVIGGVSLFGGRGTLIGVIIGVMMLGVINSSMNIMLMESAMQEVVKGAIIITAVGIDCLRRR